MIKKSQIKYRLPINILRINKLISLKSKGDPQPFYPKNYCPLPQATVKYISGSRDSKLAYSENDSKTWMYSLSSDTAGWYQNPVIPSNSVYVSKQESQSYLNRSNTIQKNNKRTSSNNSNNSNKENVNGAKMKELIKRDLLINNGFNFPDGGWVCSFCQNYNFCGRIKWNRWYKIKTKEDSEGKPQHIIRKEIKNKRKIEENNVNNMINVKKLVKPKIQAFKAQQDNSQHVSSETSNDMNNEKLGDWVWFSWSNLNFSFRKICNRCKLSREESDLQHYSMQPNAMSTADPLVWFQFSCIPHSFQ